MSAATVPVTDVGRQCKTWWSLSQDVHSKEEAVERAAVVVARQQAKGDPATIACFDAAAARTAVAVVRIERAVHTLQCPVCKTYLHAEGLAIVGIRS